MSRGSTVPFAEVTFGKASGERGEQQRGVGGDQARRGEHVVDRHRGRQHAREILRSRGRGERAVGGDTGAQVRVRGRLAINGAQGVRVQPWSGRVCFVCEEQVHVPVAYPKQRGEAQQPKHAAKKGERKVVVQTPCTFVWRVYFGEWGYFFFDGHDLDILGRHDHTSSVFRIFNS